MPQENLLIFISLFNLGLMGGFTHCTSMCGPFILTQVTNRLQTTSLEEFSNLQRLKTLALFPYQLGRITTYSIIGFCSAFLVENISDFLPFKILSAILLFGAAFFFLKAGFNLKFTNFSLPFKLKRAKNKVSFTDNLFKFIVKKSKFLRLAKRYLSNFFSNLFINPRGLNGYLLGLMLGFIPCGLLYGAFMLSSAIKPPILAGLGMIIFGVATIPSLFLTAIGSYAFFRIKYLKLKFLVKAIILINALTLVLMAINILN
jgi:sulfite exporter TauE/SafE